jgi:hypothetical protein
MTVLDRVGSGSAAPAVAPARPGAVLLRRALAYLRAAYSLDLRSLALFRIALGSVLLGDLIVRASDLRAFYTDFGVLPRAALLDKFSPAERFSVHLMSGQSIFEVFLFFVAAVFMVMLVLGVRTKLATAMSWFLLVSVQTRNPAILQGGDVYMRLLTFIAVFLPLGAVYSVDSALDTSPKEERRGRRFSLFSVAGLALFVQVACVYLFAVLLKTSPQWRKEFSAVYYALNIQQMSTPLGRLLLHFPKLLPWLTRWTLFQEGSLPFLLITPLIAGPARFLAVLMILVLHASLGFSIRLGHFPFIACAAALPLLPGWFWERKWVRRLMPWSSGEANYGSGIRIYYDKNCPFCFKAVHLLRTFLIVPGVELVPAQDVPTMELEMREHQSWIVAEPDGKHWHGWQGLAEVFSYSPLFPWMTPIMRRNWVALAGEDLYRDIEKYRHIFSRYTDWIKPRRMQVRTTLLVNIVGLLLIAAVVKWNLSAIHGVRFRPWEESTVLTLDLDQRWDMFSPNPLTYDGWYVIDGRLRNRDEVNVLHPNQPVSFDQPTDISDQYKNERWRKYLMNLYLPENSNYRLYYGRYICRSWNTERSANDPQILVSFDIYFMGHQNSIAHPPVGFNRNLLWHHECFK